MTVNEITILNSEGVAPKVNVRELPNWGKEEFEN